MSNAETASSTANETLITVTPSAVKETMRLMAEEGDGNLYLRLGVESGGCSGLSYSMGFDSKKTESDREFLFEGLRTLVDARSLLYMTGVTLDFAGGLNGGGFKFINPRAQRSCGCGSSFSV